jgi:hypothetical protein
MATEEFEMIRRVQDAIKAARPALAQRILLDPVAHLIAHLFQQVANTPEPDRDYAVLDATGAILNLFEAGSPDITLAMAAGAEYLLEHKLHPHPVGDSQT